MMHVRKAGLPLLMMLFLLLLGCRGPGGQAANIGGTTNASPGASTQPSASAMPGQTAGPSGNPATSPAPSNAETPAMGKVTAVRLADAKTGWTGGEGWIARTDDGGKHWQMQYNGKETVSQLFALNNEQAWATSADSSTLLATKDGGKKWTAVGKVPNDGFLHFVSTQEAFAANARTTDGGITWSTLPIPERTVSDAYFHDKNNGWAVTQGNGAIEVNRTADGGKTWKPVMSKTGTAAEGAVIRSAGADDAWVELIGGSGMSQTSYALFHTTDGGSHWQTVIANSTAGAGPAPGFPVDYKDGPHNEGAKPGPLYVVNTNVAFMGGHCPACDKPNTLGSTKDGGKTWVNGPSSFPGYGNALLAIADADHGWWICTDNKEPSVMYVTSDGGKSWSSTYTFSLPK